MSTNEYTPTIGIECHVQLKTKTKLFAAVDNDATSAEPNTLISHICVGLPGALPVLNQAAIDLSSKAAFALGTEPEVFSYFERKHYFYPDLPKGYQITQLAKPIITGGHLHIQVDGQKKCIKIERSNLEEDAGKNTHPAGADYSLVDLNRAGTPLLEIVSCPDINSSKEAKAYARELWLTMKYAGVTDGDLFHGHVRFDVNVSVSQDKDKLGTRSETKNLNSFKSVEAAVEFEISRQVELLEKGQSIIQETRGWDEAKQKTISQRSKEEAEDYRYMPEPDVPPVELSQEYIDQIKQSMPELPQIIREKLSGIKIDSRVIEDLLDKAGAVKLVLSVLKNGSEEAARRAAFWLLLPDVNLGDQATEESIDYKRIIELSGLVDQGKLNSSAAKSVFGQLSSSTKNPLEIAKEMNLVQVSDESELETAVSEVLAQNQKAADDVRNGEIKAIGFLVGQVMIKSKGKANPEIVKKLIKKQLNV